MKKLYVLVLMLIQTLLSALGQQGFCFMGWSV